MARLLGMIAFTAATGLLTHVLTAIVTVCVTLVVVEIHARRTFGRGIVESDAAGIVEHIMQRAERRSPPTRNIEARRNARHRCTEESR